MRKTYMKKLTKKPIQVSLTAADIRLAEKLSKQRGESASRLFRSLMKEEIKRIKERPHRNKIERQNIKIREILDAVEKSIRVMN